MEIFVLDIFERFFVGGDAFEPAERGDHAEEEMKFGVFDDLGLLEDDGFGGIEAGSEEIDGDLERVLGDGGSVGVVAGEGVPVGDEVEAVVGRIVLETDPVLEGAEVVADVEASGGAHAGEYSIGGGGQEVRSSIDGMSEPS